ncbi:MAG: hypothetical protein CME13_11730 [Gemmatimonadetes bacterium]|nr:hypothetical protein [Gemmatimonadota bacterium]
MHCRHLPIRRPTQAPLRRDVLRRGLEGSLVHLCVRGLGVVILMSLAMMVGCTDQPVAPPVNSQIARGEQLLDASRYPEAIAVFQSELKKTPTSAPLYALLARAFNANEQLQDAVGAYERCLELDPDDGDSRVQLAILLTRLDQLPKAEQHLREAVQRQPRLAAAHRILGRIHYREARYDQAAEAYQVAVDVDPQFAIAWSDLGQAETRRGNLEAAEGAYRQAIGADTTDAAYRDGLGFVLFKRREYTAAAEQLEHALRMDPLHARSHFNLGNTYLRLGRRQEGQRLLERFRELDDQERRIYGLEVTILQDPERATLYHDLAVIHTKRGETEKARRRYIQAVLRDSNYAAAYHNLGTIQLRRGQLREAMGLYRRALRADSTYVLAYRSLGNVYMRMRQVSAAVNTFEAGLRLEPDNEDLLNRARIAREILAESTQ